MDQYYLIMRMFPVEFENIILQVSTVVVRILNNLTLPVRDLYAETVCVMDKVGNDHFNDPVEKPGGRGWTCCGGL